MTLFLQFLLVAVGGAVGGAARYGVAVRIVRRKGDDFPWETLVVNVTGALVLGVLAGGILPFAAPDAAWWSFLAVGVLGSYTTVSSFSLQTLDLVQGGRVRSAAANVALSLVLCIAAAAGGFVGVRALVWG